MAAAPASVPPPAERPLSAEQQNRLLMRYLYLSLGAVSAMILLKSSAVTYCESAASMP